MFSQLFATKPISGLDARPLSTSTGFDRDSERAYAARNNRSWGPSDSLFRPTLTGWVFEPAVLRQWTQGHVDSLGVKCAIRFTSPRHQGMLAGISMLQELRGRCCVFFPACGDEVDSEVWFKKHGMGYGCERGNDLK